MSTIATEPIGSIPRPAYLQQAMQALDIKARVDGTRLAGKKI